MLKLKYFCKKRSKESRAPSKPDLGNCKKQKYTVLRMKGVISITIDTVRLNKI